MSMPEIYNPDDHYQNNGLDPFTMTLTYTGTTSPVDLTGASAKMALMDGSRLGFSFDSAQGTISILPGGVIQFNEIKEWKIAIGKYLFDLKIKDSTGFVRTYVKGTWNVIPAITK